MKTKRLFIGTFIDKSLFKERLPSLQKEFSSAVSGKWVEIENLHFTYKFLGDVNTEEISLIKESLSDYLREFNTVMLFKGLGCFPNARNPRVLFASIINEDRLLEGINKKIEGILSRLGFPPENKAFKSHITLCRIKSVSAGIFRNLAESHLETYFGTMEKISVDLIESRLTPQGPIYSVIT